MAWPVELEAASSAGSVGLKQLSIDRSDEGMSGSSERLTRRRV